MKRLLAATLLVLSPGLAMAATLGDIDADGNGTLSLEELQAVFPALTEETMAPLDTNGDGALDEAEFTAAVDSGQLVAAE